MTVEILKKFEKDVDKINDKEVLQDIIRIIDELKTSLNLSSLKKIKKMEGFKDFYRIKLNYYRLGIQYFSEENRVVLVRFLHRKDIYKYFP
ncbi:MAG TPA: plasmid stabilization protein [Spirochaetia bacterium]|nr:MAG: hypothetical protein A2Y41_03345 [Spirochaetes bacterium GWB1_36_13]HCL57885.1 plasmid stabilization protein [Spirochaetia bacterium]